MTASVGPVLEVELTKEGVRAGCFGALECLGGQLKLPLRSREPLCRLTPGQLSARKERALVIQYKRRVKGEGERQS